MGLFDFFKKKETKIEEEDVSLEPTIELHDDSFETAKWIWKNLIPKSGQANSVQGEIMRSIEGLRWEAQENGNINWDNGFEKYLNLIELYLCNEKSFSKDYKDSLKKDIERLRNFITPVDLKTPEDDYKLPYVDDDLYDRLTDALVFFCRENPVIIKREIDANQHR